MTDRKTKAAVKAGTVAGYDSVLSEVSSLLEAARRTSVRAINAIMTTTYWEIGRRIVEHEQKGREKAGYGVELIARLSIDLTGRFGRGFGPVNLSQMRKFFLCWPPDRIFQTASEKLQTPSAEFSLREVATRFPLPWSHYVRLLSAKSAEARSFYEAESLRGGWSVRQLDRQINSQFYERTALSRNKAAMLKKGGIPLPDDVVTAYKTVLPDEKTLAEEIGRTRKMLERQRKSV